MIGAASILSVVNGEQKSTSKQIGSSNQATDFSAVVALLLGGVQKGGPSAKDLLSSASEVNYKGKENVALSESGSVNSVITQLIAAVSKEQTIDLSQLKVAGVKVSPENLTPKGVVNLIQSLQLLLKQTQVATKQNSSATADLSQWESLYSDLQAGKSILAKISLPEGEISLLFLSNSVDPQSNDATEQQLDSDTSEFTLLLMPPVAHSVEQQELIKRTGFSKISLAEFDYKSAVPVQLDQTSISSKPTPVDPLVKTLIALAKQEELTPVQIEKLVSKLKTQLSRVINNTASETDSTVSVSPEVINSIIARVIQAFNDEQSLQTDPKFKEIITKLFSGGDDNKAIQQIKLELAAKSSEDPSLTMVINTKKSETNIVQVSNSNADLSEQKLVSPFASAYNNDSELKQALSAIKEIFQNSDKNVFKSVVDATALKPANTKVEIDTNSDGVKTVVLNFKSGEKPIATETNSQSTEQAIKTAYSGIDSSESTPIASKPTSETQPVEGLTKEELKPQTTTKPIMEAKPLGITQTEVKQAETLIKAVSSEAVKSTEQAIKTAYSGIDSSESTPITTKQPTETKPVGAKAVETKQTEIKQSEVKSVEVKPTPEIKSGEAVTKEELKPQTTTKPTTEVKPTGITQTEVKQAETLIKAVSSEAVKSTEQAIKTAYSGIDSSESTPIASKPTSEEMSSERKMAQETKTEPSTLTAKEHHVGKAVKEEVVGKSSIPATAQRESVKVEKSTPKLANGNEELTLLKEVSEVNLLPSEEIKIVAAVYEKSGKRQLKIAVNDEVISQKIENFIKEQPIIKNFEVRVVRPEGQVTEQENQSASKPAIATNATKHTHDTVEKATGFDTSEQSTQSNTNSGFTNKDQSFSAFAQTSKTEVLPREVVELRDLEITKSSRAHEIISEVTKFIQKKDANRLTLLLEPETLGKVKVVLSVIDDSMKARIEVENNTVKKILESNVNQLLSSNNSNQSVQLTSVQITVANGDNKQQRQQQHQQHKKKSGGKEFNIESKPEVNEPSKSMGYNTYDYIV